MKSLINQIFCFIPIAFSDKWAIIVSLAGICRFLAYKNIEEKEMEILDIGQKIKQLRIQKGLTLEELASRSELTKGFLSQMERDLTSPSIATLNDILEALGTTLAEFFKEEKEEQLVFH